MSIKLTISDGILSINGGILSIITDFYHHIQLTEELKTLRAEQSELFKKMTEVNKRLEEREKELAELRFGENNEAKFAEVKTFCKDLLSDQIKLKGEICHKSTELVEKSEEIITLSENIRNLRFAFDN